MKANCIREVDVAVIKDAVAKLCVSTNIHLPHGMRDIISRRAENEESKLGKDILIELCDNMDAAESYGIPVCQDTGMTVIFMEIGQDVHFIGGSLEKAANEGVAQGYVNGGLRLSVVKDPLDRVNTNNNTPCILHTKLVQGDKVKIIVAPKGFGSENMSALKMFTPAASEEDIINFVVETVSNAGSNPCPPITLGVGIGGDFELCAILAKKALCRDMAVRNSNPFYARMEEKLLDRINSLGIGPQGFGGRTTALYVNIETYATHIAGLPVAVNMGCHVNRHGEVVV